MRRTLLAAARVMTGTRTVSTAPAIFPPPTVTVVYKPKAIDEAIKRAFYRGEKTSEPRLIGFDIEHKPVTRKGATPSVHLVHVTSASCDECLLLHVGAAGLSQMSNEQLHSSVPHFAKLLGDENIVAAGVGVRGDLDRLHGSHPFLFGGNPEHPNSKHIKTLDSQVVHLFYHPHENGAGVAKLATFHNLSHSQQLKSITMSDWSLAPLSERQIRYASEDASLSFQIAKRQFEKYGDPHNVTFETWSDCFTGVDSALAMDARVADILRENQKYIKPSLPPSMLAVFRAHHSMVTKLRRMRQNALRWRQMTVTLAKHDAHEPGFASPVSALEILSAHSVSFSDSCIDGEEESGEDTGEESFTKNPRSVPCAYLRVRYDHSVVGSDTGDTQTGGAFKCVASVTLPVGFQNLEHDGRIEVINSDTRACSVLVSVGRGRTKRNAKETAARGALGKVRKALDGNWVCHSAVAWLTQLSQSERKEVVKKGLLCCGENCKAAGVPLVGPRERVGVNRPAHFVDEAGWVSCVRSVGKKLIE